MAARTILRRVSRLAGSVAVLLALLALPPTGAAGKGARADDSAGAAAGARADDSDALARELEREMERERAAEREAMRALMRELQRERERELERHRQRERAAEGAARRERGREPALERETSREPTVVSPCVPDDPSLLQLGGDVILHRKLSRDDFRARRKLTSKRDAVVHVPGARVGAHVALMVACVGPLRTERRPDGRWEAWIENVRYYALLDREGSWWNDRSGANPAWVLRHEQLHFDLAELVARRHNRAVEAGRPVRAVGDSEYEALAGSARIWHERLDAVYGEFRELERRYDFETRHGTALREQTRWFEQTLRELAATGGLAQH